MTNTTNYNLILAEGTDLVNYLTQTNPNFSNLDSIIKGVSDLTVTPATEVATGTAHAISKNLPDATVIKFTATSNWLTGDTMTLDGNPVTPLKTDGTTLKTGDYIIGSAVLMIQDGTRLTVLVASSPDASDINYDNSISGLASNKVQGAIDENAAAIDNINSKLTIQSDSNVGNIHIQCVKYGRVCTVSFENSDIITADAGDPIVTLPSQYWPNYAVSFVDPINTNRRITINNSGIIRSTVAISGASIRGYATYITRS